MRGTTEDQGPQEARKITWGTTFTAEDMLSSTPERNCRELVFPGHYERNTS